MNNKPVFFRPHPDPIVQALLNIELVPDKMLPILSDPAIAANPKIQAIILILLADLGFKSAEEVNKFCESVYMISCHVDLQLIFLAAWFGHFVGLNNTLLDQMNAVETSMNGLINQETLPEVKATVDSVKCINCFYRGDYITMHELAEHIVDNIPHESFYYKKFATLRAMSFFSFGMGTNAYKDLSEVTPSDFDSKGLILSKLANCALTGNLQETSFLINQIAQSPQDKYLQVSHSKLEISCSIIKILTDFYGNDLASPQIEQHANLTKNWARSTQALLERKPEEALHWARLYTDEKNKKAGQPLDFLDHTLVRAELALGNGSSAKRLLLHLRELGTQTYIDDFYFARAELLLDNRNLAALHFEKLKNSLKKYQAQKRFDFEVAMALELEPTDLVELATTAVEISKKDLDLQLKTNLHPTGLDAIISVSTLMNETKEAVLHFANLDLPVLITGETGTGKELIARCLHDLSSRSNQRFIAINCGSISDALIESELFGHTTGAFTGAQSAYKGIFREAGEGTVFLDEIADISPQLQVSLLRVLETGEIRPVGSSSNHKIKCKIVIATNKPLPQLVTQGKFRDDLYYRLQRLEIQLPPLHQRPEDIVELTKYFFNFERISSQKATFSQDLIEHFMQYHWPGNVRELRNIIQRMRILSSDKLHYDLSDLIRCNGPLEQQQMIIQPTSDSPTHLNQASTTFRRKKRLRELFDQHGELKVSETAAILGVSSNTAASYLRELCKEGYIEKIIPSASTKSRYYTKKTS